jgi:hypothetical protein
VTIWESRLLYVFVFVFVLADQLLFLILLFLLVKCISCFSCHHHHHRYQTLEVRLTHHYLQFCYEPDESMMAKRPFDNDDLEDNPDKTVALPLRTMFSV